MNITMSCAKPCLMLAPSIQIRRQQLNLTIKQAAELTGIRVKQWSAIESGSWIPSCDESVWFSLASTLQVGFENLLRIAGGDLARLEQFKRAA